jgi:hypothetical protein
MWTPKSNYLFISNDNFAMYKYIISTETLLTAVISLYLNSFTVCSLTIELISNSHKNVEFQEHSIYFSTSSYVHYKQKPCLRKLTFEYKAWGERCIHTVHSNFHIITQRRRTQKEPYFMHFVTQLAAEYLFGKQSAHFVMSLFFFF